MTGSQDQNEISIIYFSNALEFISQKSVVVEIPTFEFFPFLTEIRKVVGFIWG